MALEDYCKMKRVSVLIEFNCSRFPMKRHYPRLQNPCKPNILQFRLLQFSALRGSISSARFQSSYLHSSQLGTSSRAMAIPDKMQTAINSKLQKQITGPKFVGVKMIPPGVHMVSFNSVSSQGDFSPTSSFFVAMEKSQVPPLLH